MKFGTVIHGTLMIHRTDFGDPHMFRLAPPWVLNVWFPVTYVNSYWIIRTFGLDIYILISD